MVFVFSNWLIPLSIMFSRSIYTVAVVKFTTSLWLSRIPLCKCPIVVLSISSMDGHQGCFHILVIVKNTTMNIGVLMFLQISVLDCFGYIPRSGITGSKGRCIFNFFKCLHIAFHSTCTSLHSHQQCKRVPFLHILASTCLLIY